MRLLTLAGRAAGLVLGLAVAATPLLAQQRRYLFEVGGAAAYTSFDSETNLDAGLGGVGRVGVWLPYRFSVEGEVGYAAPSSTVGPGWNVTTYSFALLGNFPLGLRNSVYGKAGYGSSSYDSNLCPVTPLGPCNSTGHWLGGVGIRYGITETIMLRAEGVGSFASGESTAGDYTLVNFGISAGVSLMLASRPVIDTDRDLVFDDDDDCPATPLGALVDPRGCPTDADSDKVPDGLDRCPATPAGATVNAAGCPQDADADNVADGLDRCADTPAGAAVDPRGCPLDGDADGVFDGLDRCPDTPKDASVDQLGCPGDEDSDGVLDGLDRCPRTPPGTRVNTFGCPPGVERATGGTLLPGSRRILSGVSFAPGSARLPASATAPLDSLAEVLTAQPRVSVEIAAHGDGSASESLHLTQLRAEAVRRYLISKGISLQRITAKGYGAGEPVSRGTSAAARNANRRIEVRVLQVAPAR